MLAKVEHLLDRRGHWRAVELITAELLRRGVVSGWAARHFFEHRACRPTTACQPGAVGFVGL